MFNRTALVFLLLTASAAFNAQGQAPITLGNAGGYRVSISAPGQAARIGNAVLLRYHSFNAELKYGTSSRILVSCDGSWISTAFRNVFQFGEAITPFEQEKYAGAKEEPLEPLAIYQVEVSKSDIEFAEKIARKAPKYCTKSGREPRNEFIPVSKSAEINGIFNATSLVSGTSARVGGSVDVWLRTTEYKQESVTQADGKQFLIDGVAQTSPNPTGKYMMQRFAHDCSQRRIGLYERSIYEAGKATPESESVQRERLRLSAVTPGTTGESQLDWVCALYGSPINGAGVTR